MKYLAKTILRMKSFGIIKLSKGKNTIGIEKSWGWVQIDYIEITEFEATPWNISIGNCNTIISSAVIKPVFL